MHKTDVAAVSYTHLDVYKRQIDYMNRHGDMLAVDCNPEFKENQYRKLLLDYLE